MASATALPETEIVPDMDGTTTPGVNSVYCATFKLAWNEMRDALVRGPILLEGDLPI
ncbi:MAG: hypothetical protein ACYTG0_26010 [Planctomycetota bacterium]|jgi:hypothetical protein